MLNDAQAKALCEKLILADREEEVIDILLEAGYWDDPVAWRLYDDNENNFATINNQQSRPDAALVEKLTNCIDARLIGECRARGGAPDGTRAPQSMREAVARYFPDRNVLTETNAGLLRNWSPSWLTGQSRHITLTATGNTAYEGNPSLTIVDSGEGQTPEMMPVTFLSLTKSNKLRIPFVQGKFNMGSTGVLKFCGKHKLQLIVTRRDPRILAREGLGHASDGQWGFTVVRRQDPQAGCKNSCYTYLAPVPGRAGGPRGVLRFSAETLLMFPVGNLPYARPGTHGALIKLYEFDSTGRRSHLLRSHGLLERLDLLLPEAALPIRLHECRRTGGSAGSCETTLTGLTVRLDQGKTANLEHGFPSSCAFTIQGKQITARIYAFKKGLADNYRRNEGVLFTINGQTHGILSADFFKGKKVGLSYLADSLLVLCACEGLDSRAREDLFMNSRDRLADTHLRKDVLRELEEILNPNNHSGLQHLLKRRRREELAARLEDTRPLAEVLESLLRSSPALAQLFLPGLHIFTPTETVKVKARRERLFEGKQFPTFFRFRGKPSGVRLTQRCLINTRCRVLFETDAVNDYFQRDSEPGHYRLYRVKEDGVRIPVEASSLTPHNGVATLSLRLPEDCAIDQRVEFVLEVSDPSRADPIENAFTVTVQAVPGKSGGDCLPSPSNESGEDLDIQAGVQLPNIIRVSEKAWDEHDPPFDATTALHVKHAETRIEGGRTRELYDFFVNVDNGSLRSEQRAGRHERDLLESRFIYGIVLLGLGLLEQDASRTVKDGPTADEKTESDIEDAIERFSRGVAPVLLPMIESLGNLDLEAVGPSMAEEVV
jgi:hypothetical protein